MPIFGHVSMVAPRGSDLLAWWPGRRREAARLREQALSLLRQAVTDPTADFREGQWEAIERLIRRRQRLLVVQRTGWGKSVVYFMTTRLLRDRGAGPTVLISPLLALMRDQLRAAIGLGLRAATINSSNMAEWGAVYARVRADEVDLLLVSPERLADERFREEVLRPLAGRIGFFVVDEAHCVSDWGHDFRPDYRHIARVVRALPRGVPVLATTATANERVVRDAAAGLGARLRVLRGPLARPSLRLQNIYLPTLTARMAWLAEHVPRLPGSGIIYTLTVRDTQRLAGWLQAQGIDAHAYWGGLDAAARQDLERRLLDNRIKALVATPALALSLDKPDLGFVVHYQRPASVVHYYQQVGRAGRRLDTAYGILLHGEDDQQIVAYLTRVDLPSEQQVEEVLGALNRAEDGLSPAALEQQVNLSRYQIERVLKRLAARSPALVGQRGDRWYATSSWYVPDTMQVEDIRRRRRHEQERMLAYTENRECLMLFLTRELDDLGAAPCGRCAVCTGVPLLPEEYSPQLAAVAEQFLRRNDQVIQPRTHWPGALVAGERRGALPLALRAEPGRALCVWGDGGWGEVVRRGKEEDNRFDDALVAAVVALLRERWQPVPRPVWVTCVPSLRHPELVPDFARRVAQALELPFIAAVCKVRPTEPQKRMQNSYRQVHNLEGAFAVAGSSRERDGLRGPVLLLDDMVDSGWTFTIVGALLRAAGSGPVFPLALAVTAGTKSEERHGYRVRP